MIFGIKLLDDVVVDKFFTDTHERLQTNFFFKNSRIDKVATGFYIVDITPMTPNFSIVFIGLMLIFFVFHLIPSAIAMLVLFMIVTIFYNNAFIYLILRKGVKKVGYSGKVELLSDAKCIRELTDRIVRQYE